MQVKNLFLFAWGTLLVDKIISSVSVEYRKTVYWNLRASCLESLLRGEVDTSKCRSFLQKARMSSLSRACLEQLVSVGLLALRSALVPASHTLLLTPISKTKPTCSGKLISTSSSKRNNANDAVQRLSATSNTNTDNVYGWSSCKTHTHTHLHLNSQCTGMKFPNNHKAVFSISNALPFLLWL